MAWRTVETRLGAITLLARDGAVCRILLPGADMPALDEGDSLRPQDPGADAAVLEQAAMQVREYADGRRRELTFPIRFEGTPFQEAVWAALQQIPAGETRTYGELAQTVGVPGAARAVGQANRANPLPLAVPCHRVVARDGLGGYMGELENGIKARILALEGAPTSPLPDARRE